MPSIAEQSTEQLGGRGSLLARQRRDHVALDALLDALPTAGGRAQDELLQRIARLVFPHAYAEETVIWPAARAVLPDGEQLTLRVEQEHQEINELWSALEVDHGSARDQLLARLSALLRQDVRDEEDELLPRLQAALTTQQLRRLGRTWEIVRRTAPSRPHPVVARRPPGNLLAAVPLAVLDRARDALDRTARGTTGTGGRAAREVSRGLAVAAGLIEQLPPLHAGEDTSTERARRQPAGGAPH